MQENPLVSCTIIFFNQEKFIEEAIASVINQTYQNWELLLVDDGSTDKSTQIAQNYAEKYPEKIKYLEHENHQNRGNSATRNLGLKYAKGDLIGFLDGDDVWLPKKLEEQIIILKNNPSVKMIYGRTVIWYSWTGKPEDQDRNFFMSLGVEANTIVQPPELIIKLLDQGCQAPTTCNPLIRKEVFKEIGTFEEQFKDLYDDRVFFSKIQLKAPIFVADNYWAKYRRHPDSLCSNVTQDQVNDRQKAYYDWLEEYMLKENIINTELGVIIQRNQPPSRILRKSSPLLYYFWQLNISNTIHVLSKLVIKIGRITLSQKLRDWLWYKLGQHIYRYLVK
ncbi:glycosyltransferase family 2 protein [Geminocystis sp.]|uniref:glycosyltransferase family 2 protein n=1 Tax=Geminocystis sp. TaxID=2664100 RepID=UPI0035936A44